MYEDARVCKARLAWRAFGDNGALPGSPARILGICVHEVASAVQSNRLGVNANNIEDEARSYFDAKAEELFAQAHETFRVKFGVKERLPYYYLRREEAAALTRSLAVRTEGGGARSSKPSSSFGSRSVEKSLSSKDGLLYGRPDVVDAASREVVDIKTRSESDEVRENEIRQLRLYAHLARENGIEVERGAILLSNGKRLEIKIAAVEVQREAHSAVAALQSYNEAVSVNTTFEEIASPSAENCRYCPCKVLCEAFWRAADPSWGEEAVGNHIQGTIAAVSESNLQGVNLIALHLQDASGTVVSAGGEVVLEQMPMEWLAQSQNVSQAEGKLVRIINAKISVSSPEQTVLRADRVSTEVWVLD
jgi:CRISPR/Cas system-associated exonuclease Cas4 (RecB family)